MTYFYFSKYLLKSSLTGEERIYELNFKKSVNVKNNIFENYDRIIIHEM